MLISLLVIVCSCHSQRRAISFGTWTSHIGIIREWNVMNIISVNQFKQACGRKSHARNHVSIFGMTSSWQHSQSNDGSSFTPIGLADSGFKWQDQLELNRKCFTLPLKDAGCSESTELFWVYRVINIGDYLQWYSSINYWYIPSIRGSHKSHRPHYM